MTDNLPAIPGREPTREIAKADTDSWTGMLQNIGHLAEIISGTEFVPKSLRNSAPAVAAAIMYGREVGLPPMTALTQTHVIEGRPSMSAAAKRGLVLAAGHEIEVLESTGAICRLRSRRRGSSNWSAEVVWTIDMARAAGLTNKANWKNHPRQMLTARASGELCDRDFPDVVLGFATVEDVEDDGGQEAAAEVASSTVVRRAPAAKKAAARKAAALPAAKAAARPEPDGPPLPGEPGYDEPAADPAPETTEAPTAPRDQPADVSDDAAPSSHEDAAGSTEDTPAGDKTEAGAAEQGEGNAAPAEDQPRAKKAPPSGPITRPQTRMILSQFGRLGIDSNDREERLALTVGLVGREVDSTTSLTKAEATTLIDTLAKFETREALNGFLDELDAARGQGAEVAP